MMPEKIIQMTAYNGFLILLTEDGHLYEGARDPVDGWCFQLVTRGIR